MSNNSPFRRDSYGNWIDPGGNVFNGGGSPPSSGDPITVHGPNGRVSGRLVGTEAVPDKQSK